MNSKLLVQYIFEQPEVIARVVNQVNSLEPDVLKRLRAAVSGITHDLSDRFRKLAKCRLYSEVILEGSRTGGGIRSSQLHAGSAKGPG